MTLVRGGPTGCAPVDASRVPGSWDSERPACNEGLGIPLHDKSSSSSSVVWTLWNADVPAGQQACAVCGDDVDEPVDEGPRPWIVSFGSPAVHDSASCCPHWPGCPSTDIHKDVHRCEQTSDDRSCHPRRNGQGRASAGSWGGRTTTPATADEACAPRRASPFPLGQPRCCCLMRFVSSVTWL